MREHYSLGIASSSAGENNRGARFVRILTVKHVGIRRNSLRVCYSIFRKLLSYQPLKTPEKAVIEFKYQAVTRKSREESENLGVFVGGMAQLNGFVKFFFHYCVHDE